MNFNLVPVINLIDVGSHYKQIAEQFCSNYYLLYQNNPGELKNLFVDSTLVTIFNEETVGYYGYINLLRSFGVAKLRHQGMNIVSHPLDSGTVLISVRGVLCVNDFSFTQNFSEILILRRDDNNRFFISNLILSLQ